MSIVLQYPESNRTADPTEFYDLLPTDHSPANQTGALANGWATLFSILIDSTLDGVEQTQLDDLSLLLLQTATDDICRKQMRDLADHFSTLYVQALLERTENIYKKMSLQRLNFFLRSLLDANIPTASAADETKLAHPCPWDWAAHNQTTVYVVSRRPNVIIERNGSESALQLGLPTQIDVMANGRFSVGSYYSPGGYRIDNSNTEFIPHESPIILQLIVEGCEWFLDSRGRLFDRATGDHVSIAPTSNVTRARRFGQLLYVMDWTVASIIYTFDLQRRIWRTHSIPAVFLPNDLLRLNDDLYVIDKQQGHIFKFDPEFHMLGKQCGFGRGPDRLFDPIAIHATRDESRLQVMNWVPGSITSVPRF